MNRLAIDGGKPIRKTYLPYGRQWIDDDDIQAVVDVLKSDWITTGAKVGEFEEKFAEYVGAKYAVAVSSGTAALHAAVFAAGIGPGDEVVTTPLSFAATSNCVLYQGGTPVFADIQKDTLNINPKEILKKINNKTKAIIPVDFAGQPCDYDEILKIAKEHNLIVIEDAAHALGAEYKGRKLGSMADMTIFSFHPVKHITTGEGGMITTNDAKLAERLRRFRNHGFTSEARQREDRGSWFYEMIDLGYNYRLTDFQCALGISQLKKIEKLISLRQQIANSYNKAFANLPEIRLAKAIENVRHVWHIYVIQLNLEQLHADRPTIFKALRAENIGVNVHYIPIPLHPYYKKRFGNRQEDFPVTASFYDSAITLPLFSKMTQDDISSVIYAVEKVLSYYRN